ncbi:MAG: AAA family ATPase [Spirochaetales bacterium]|nr:AAA family ATPase [Spirochaetales bacterium]
MQTLFGNTEGGYRLISFEFFNWGCFDNTIWKITPRGKTSLLTGANGSGKTTLVDALVTLLVPPSKRHYNQSSGADRKRERTEESYIRGAYGSMRGEESITRKTQYLREGDVFSCLLGIFFNESFKRTLTLGQIRFFSPGKLKRVYFSADTPLSIKEDIYPAIVKTDFKRVLRDSNNILFYDSFQQYANYFTSIFGLRSEKALSLFSHIVGVKVLGNLNEFIRTNMLEAPDMEFEFGKLYTNYQTLFNAHQKIELAEKQLELLEPVIKYGRRYDKLSAKVKEKKQLLALLPGFFARYICKRLSLDLKNLNDEIEHLSREEARLTKDREQLERERRTIQAAIDQNDTAQRIKGIESEVTLCRERKEQKVSRWNRYQTIAGNLGFLKVSQEEDFQDNKKTGEIKKQEINESLDNVELELFAAHNKINELSGEYARLEQEIESLRKRKSNIPLKNIRVRERIAGVLSVSPRDLPFAGELIKVKEDQLEWELAAEQLLHNFGLCLLIDECHYDKVNNYVNGNDLKNRLIYFKAKTGSEWEFLPEIEETSLIYKLQVKPDSPFRTWVENYIHSRFDYICVNSVKQFHKFSKAVTAAGLIKNESRHEKDDRPVRKGRDSYILGWDNRPKLAFLMQQAHEVNTRKNEQEELLYKWKREREQLERIKDDLKRLLEFTHFNEIDWWTIEKKIGELEKEKNDLLSRAKDLRSLHQKLESIEKQIDEMEKELKKINQFIGGIGIKIENLGKVKQVYEQILSPHNSIDFNEYESLFIPYAGEKLDSLDFESLQKQQDKGSNILTAKLDTVQGERIQIEKNLIRVMTSFINPRPDILRNYPSWVDITVSLKPEVEFLPDFQRVYDELKKDDLPKYKRDFKEFLNEKMLEDMVHFNESLGEGEKDIKESISELNNVLKGIDYNKVPATYIVLNSEESRNSMIKEFRSSLKNILGDAFKLAARDEEELEHTFKKMQKLILDLNEDTNKRKKVLDVRNWLRFSATERYKEDSSEKQFYEDSQSLSGGEKAKLAYTILASAIAYQFGIQGNENPDRSFRFAIVDEAFSKVDPENSIYAMELFNKMELQLMLVTPLDKINLTENYIHSVHFVESGGGIRSNLYNLTLEEYKEKKNAFKAMQNEEALETVGTT